MNTVNASIITIGDELLIGQTIDTNSAFIAQELNKIGVWVRRRVAVGDVYDDIWQALDEERRTSQIIIITGGLGPTADDITKPLLCKYFGGKMVVNEDVLKHVKYLFEVVFRRPPPILDVNLKQAEVPDTATVLHNARGTAPGMWFDVPASDDIDKRVFISLPGVPHEMKGLIMDEVLPRLQQHFTMPFIFHRTIFTSGIGESMLADFIKDFEKALPPAIKLAYLPGYGMVKLRLTTSGSNKEKLEKELTGYFDQLKELVKEFMVTDRDDPMEKVIGQVLKSKGKTMATAESCTGGYIAQMITSVAGSSAYYKGSVISYDNAVKEHILGVKKETIKAAGAVSEETVIEMAKGAVKELNVDYALATSGIMGPGGGTEEKPVGMVWVAAANKDRVITKQFNFRFDRERNIRQTAHSALDFLRKFILTNS
ncbi:MAG: CinA family nicotinamide mononucleotide deamidase-related protein [Chitinophagaceae bacterium]